MPFRSFSRRRRNSNPIVSLVWGIVVIIFISIQFHNSPVTTTTFIPIATYTAMSNSVPTTPTPTIDQATFNTAKASKTQTAVAAPTPVVLPFTGSGNVNQLLTALADGKCVEAALFRNNNNLKNLIRKQKEIIGGNPKHPTHTYTYVDTYSGYTSQVQSLDGKTICIVGTVDGPPVWNKTFDDLASLYFKESSNGITLSFIGWPQSIDHSLEALNGKKVKLHGIFKVSSDLTLEVSIPSQIEVLQ